MGRFNVIYISISTHYIYKSNVTPIKISRELFTKLLKEGEKLSLDPLRVLDWAEKTNSQEKSINI